MALTLESIRVVVIDDHFVSRQGIISLLATNPKLVVVAEGSAGNHATEFVAQYRPDILITDLQMPAHAGQPAGPLFEPISTLERLIKSNPSLSVIVISQEQDIATIQSLAEIGVKGYFLKTDNIARLLGSATEDIHKGTPYFSPEARRIIYGAPPPKKKSPLTEMQLNVLTAIVREPHLSRAELAANMGISIGTFNKHKDKMFVALGVNSITACILHAMRMKIISLEEYTESAERMEKERAGDKKRTGFLNG
jgi:NarL family two-component system response regulator YdfI